MAASDDSSDRDCPLCMEPLELDDINFYPCTCEYQICRFCWHRIRTDENGLCPACRQPYPENPVNFKPLTQEELKKVAIEKKQKEQQKKQKISESRKHLANLRVVQKNLVFVVGLASRIAEPETLKKLEYFGKFGKIQKVMVNNQSTYVGQQGPSSSAYVTYYKAEDALRAIQAVNNLQVDGRTMKACLGTTKYCSMFLKNQLCNKPDCMYLHEVGDQSASFTKEDMQAGKHTEYERKLIDQIMAQIPNSGGRRQGTISPCWPTEMSSGLGSLDTSCDDSQELANPITMVVVEGNSTKPTVTTVSSKGAQLTNGKVKHSRTKRSKSPLVSDKVHHSRTHQSGIGGPTNIPPRLKHLQQGHHTTANHQFSQGTPLTILTTTNKSQANDADRNVDGMASPNRSSSPSVSPSNRDQLSASLEAEVAGELDSRTPVKLILTQPSLYALENFDVESNGSPPQDPVLEEPTVSKLAYKQQQQPNTNGSAVGSAATGSIETSTVFGAPMSLNRSVGGDVVESFEYFSSSVSNSAPNHNNSVMSNHLTKSESARGALSGLQGSLEYPVNSSDEMRLHHSLSGVYNTVAPSAGSTNLVGLGVSLDSAATDWQAAFGFKSTSVPVGGGTSMMEKLFQLDQNNSDVSELMSGGSAGQFRPNFLRGTGGGLDSLSGSVPSASGSDAEGFGGLFVPSGNKSTGNLSGGAGSLIESGFHGRFSSDADDLGFDPFAESSKALEDILRLEEENHQKAKQSAALDLLVSQRNSHSTGNVESFGGGHQGFPGNFISRNDIGNRMSRPTMLGGGGGMSVPPGFLPSPQQIPSPDKCGSFQLGEPPNAKNTGMQQNRYNGWTGTTRPNGKISPLAPPFYPRNSHMNRSQPSPSSSQQPQSNDQMLSWQDGLRQLFPSVNVHFAPNLNPPMPPPPHGAPPPPFPGGGPPPPPPIPGPGGKWSAPPIPPDPTQLMGRPPPPPPGSLQPIGMHMPSGMHPPFGANNQHRSPNGPPMGAQHFNGHYSHGPPPPPPNSFSFSSWKQSLNDVSQRLPGQNAPQTHLPPPPIFTEIPGWSPPPGFSPQ